MGVKFKNWVNSIFLRNPRIKKYVENNRFLIKMNRNTVARGVAIGLFVAITPIMPIQSILAILLSILLRANLPVAVLVSFVCNPFTIAPIAYLNYYVGSLFIKNPTKLESMFNDIAWKFSYGSHPYWDWIAKFGKGYLIGLPIVAISAAILGYLSVIIWYFILDKYKSLKG